MKTRIYDLVTFDTFVLSIFFFVLAVGPVPAAGWCISKDACTVASVCDVVLEGKITYLNVPVFLLVVYVVPLLYLFYQLWWKIIAKFSQALTGTLALERQMLPIYIRWLQVLVIFFIWLIVSLFLMPINSILSVILNGVEVFGIAMFSNTLIIWMHMPDLTRISLLISLGISTIVSTGVVGAWYFTANSGSSGWTSIDSDLSYYRIIYNGLWCILYSCLLLTPYIPGIRKFAGTLTRPALYRFMLVLAATWLLGTIIATLQYLDVDGWSCVGLAQSALASLLFAFTYVSALRADSLAWRKKGYAGTNLNSSATLPLLSLSEDWRIDYDELEMGDVLARGNFAEVHRGTWRGINVAIKTLYQTQLQNTEMVEFEREVELLRQLHHPNIVLFIGACMQAPHFSIVMELMTQGSLHHVIHSERELTLHRKFLMGRDIARGMLYLHSHKPSIVHRDLKSLNILADDNLNLKVTDFGLSRKVTHSVTSVGTPTYSAPEVLRSSIYTQKSDVYSFGIIIWELLMRAEPYKEFSLFEVIHKVISDKLRPELPPPSPEHPESLLELIRRCWDDDPEVRPCFNEILEYFEVQVEETRDTTAPSWIDSLSSSTIRRSGVLINSLLPSSAASSTSTSAPPGSGTVAGKSRGITEDDSDDVEIGGRLRTATGSGEESGGDVGSARAELLLIDQAWESDADDRRQLSQQEAETHQRSRTQPVAALDTRPAEGQEDEQEEDEEESQRRRYTIND